MTTAGDRALRRDGEVLLGSFGELRERGRILHGHIGQHLAVDLHSAGLKPMHELAVGKAVRARSRADALDPQLAELPLAVAAVAVAVSLRASNGLLGALVEFALGEEETFGALQIFFPTRAALGSAFDSRHLSISCGPRL